MANSDAPDLAERMAGSSYRDMLRVSGSDRAFWQDIFQQNRPTILQAITQYEAHLRHLKQEIEHQIEAADAP